MKRWALVLLSLFAGLACDSRPGDPAPVPCRTLLADRAHLSRWTVEEILQCVSQVEGRDRRELLEDTLGLAGERGDVAGRGHVLHYLALDSKRTGDYQRSLQFNREAAEIFKRIGDNTWYSSSLHNTGVLLAALGRPREALSALEQALAIRRQQKDAERQAATLTQIGWVYYLTRDYESAIEYYDLALSQRAGLRGRAVTLDRLGSAWRDLGKSAKALDCYREALAIFRLLGEPKRGHVLANLGWLHLGRGELEAAKSHLQKALPLMRETGDRDGESHVLTGLAEVARGRGDFKTARERLEAALLIVESLRQGSVARSLRSSFFALRQDYFERYLDLLSELRHQDAGSDVEPLMFHASERSRSRALLDLLAAAPAGLAEVGTDLRRRQESLQNRIAALELRLAQGSAKGEAKAFEPVLRTQLTELLIEYELLQGGLRGRTGVKVPEPLGLEDACKLLDEDTVLLSYLLGENRSHLFLLNRDGLKYVELPPRREIQRVAEDFYRLLQKSRRILVSDQLELVGKNLSEMLLTPVAEWLGTKRILVVKDGALHYVPFAALPTPRDPHRLLLDDHEILALPSTSVLAFLRQRRLERPTPQGDIAVIAPDAGKGRLPGNGRFPRLSYVPAEVEAILSRVPPEKRLALLGADANREAILASDIGSYRILHFATHGYLATRFPELSALVLASSQNGDELLRLNEIFGLRLPVEMVVLSACETALGELLRGEGLVGMTHAFLSAGSSRVVVSLWRVEDRATAELMDEFYRGLLEDGLPAATALRRAQLSLRTRPGDRWHAPYYWAAFEIHGDWR